VSVRQKSDVPEQNSGRSQAPAAARHSKVLGRFWSTHDVDAPSHASGASQAPTGDIPQPVPLARTAFTGHVPLDVHVSWMSHGPAAARQTVPVVGIWAGHDVEPPVQVSATSQTPVLLRQIVPAGASAFIGHAFEVPLHTSGTSHSEPARHTVPADATASTGQVALAPVQKSAMSQPVPRAARQIVVEGENASGGQATLAAVQVSATSQPPDAAARHTLPGVARASVGHIALAPVHVSATSQTPAAPRHTVVDDA
jgi:hypothetical protein